MTVRGVAVSCLLVVGLVSCSSGKNLEVAKAGVQRFREQVAQHQFVEIHKNMEWESDIPKPSPEALAEFFGNTATQYGAYKSSRLISSDFDWSRAMVTLEYETVFEKGNAEERFVFYIRDGNARLARYHMAHPETETI